MIKISRIRTRIKFSFLLGLVFFLPYPSLPHELAGTWQGILNLGLVKFRAALVIKDSLQHEPEVFFNNIDDGLYDEPASLLSTSSQGIKVRLEKGQTLSLHLNAGKKLLEGSYLQAQGNFETDGQSVPLTLEAGKDYLFPRFDPNGQPITTYQFRPPQNLDDGLKIGILPSKGLLGVESGIHKILDGSFPHIHGLLVAQGDQLLVDETFYGYKPQDPHPVQSITKSVFSLLFGIAQDKHLLQINQKLYDFFPQYRSQKNWDPRKNQITLGNLLTMSSGLDCFDWKDAQACSWGMVRSEDWLDYSLSKPLIQDPGSRFGYCGACLLPLSVILERVNGMTVPQFAQQNLFDPLGIHSAKWVQAPSAGTTVVPVSFALSLSPRDLAKIGLLVLNKGKWDGKQIVSEDWIRESTSQKIPKDQTNKKYDYGYLWWKTEFKVRQKNASVIMGWGVGGNFLFIAPEKNIICVITAGNYNQPQEANNSLKLFQEDILPAFY